MNDVAFLCRAARAPLLAWLLLALVAALLECLLINAILPLVWESDSQARDVAHQAYQWMGVTDDRIFMATMVFVAIAYLGRNVFLALQGIVIARISTTVMVDTKMRLLQRVDEARYHPVSRMDAGTLGNAVLREAGNVPVALGCLVNSVSHGLFAAAVFMLTMWLEPVLIACTLAVILPGYLIIRKTFVVTRKISAEQTALNGRVQSLVVQMVLSLKYLKNTETCGRIVGVVGDRVRQQGSLRFKQLCFGLAFNNGTDLALVLLGLGMVLLHGKLTGAPGIESLFVLYIFRRSAMYAMACQTSFRQYQEVHGSIRVIQDLDRELANHAMVVDANATPPDFSQCIRMKNLSFRYRASSEVLSAIDLAVQPGSKVAIVGTSGSGKSTLLMLLTGALQPTAGDVFLGPLPYSWIDLAAMRSRTGYVAQDNVVFNDSVASNVALWEPEPSPERVRRALLMADALNFVDSLPEREMTRVGDGGNSLSGGQCQRLAIARELYKDISLLILDEATSSLDGGTERRILNNIIGMEGMTVLAVTHRIMPTRHFDTVLVLDDGHLVAQGPYEELHRTCAVFRAMADAQDCEFAPPAS